MRMAIAVAAPAGNHRQLRLHLLQKFHTAAVMRTVVSCLQHSVLLQLQPSLAFFPHVACKQHAALRAVQRRQRAGFVSRHSLLRHINQKKLCIIIQRIAFTALHHMHLRPAGLRQNFLLHHLACLRQCFVRQEQLFHPQLPQQIRRSTHMVKIIMA